MKAMVTLAVTALLLVLALPEESLPDTSPLYSCFLPLVLLPPVEPSHGVGSTYNIPFPTASWCYDWNVDPDCGPESVPMIWDETLVGAELGGDSDWLLGFNEPEMVGQANITPTLAATLWHEVEALYPDKRFVSPAASTWWLTAWWDEYVQLYSVPPRVDAVAHHCYGAWGADYAVAKCKGQVDLAVAWALSHDIQEVWVTEFAHLPCWPDGVDGTLQFMEQMVTYYRDHPNVTRWAWFQTSYYGTEPWSFGPYCNTSLIAMEDDEYYGWIEGELTPFGELYRSLATVEE